MAYTTKEAYLKNIWPNISIPVNIVPNHRASIKNRLKYGYEFSLRKRLEELINVIPTALTKEYISEKPKEFIDIVTELRNYYTHYDDPSILTVAHTDAAFHIPWRLTLILDYHLLLVTGFKPDMAERLVRGHFSQCLIKNGAAWEFPTWKGKKK